MYVLIMCVAAAAVGIDVGWQRIPEGGMEYIIQLDPHTLELLRAGEAIQSDIPPSAGNVRSYRIVVGAKKLPRETPPTPAATSKPTEPQAPVHREPPSAAPHALTPDPGGKPLPERTAVFVEPESTAGKPQPKTTVETQPEQPAKPWLALTFTLFGLFASLGANLYLGWITWDSRQRLRTAQGEASPKRG